MHKIKVWHNFRKRGQYYRTHKRSRLWPVCCQQTCQDGDLLLEGHTLKVTLPFNHLALWFLFFLIRYVVLEHKHLSCHRLLVLFVFKNRTYRTCARPILQSTIEKGLDRVGVGEFLGPFFFQRKCSFFIKIYPFWPILNAAVNF